MAEDLHIFNQLHAEKEVTLDYRVLTGTKKRRHWSLRGYNILVYVWIAIYIALMAYLGGAF